MPNLQGMKDKFSVIKHEDISAAGPQAIKAFMKLVELVCYKRAAQGKGSENTYLVINTDEPYADEVIDILKRNGHWGEEQ